MKRAFMPLLLALAAGSAAGSAEDARELAKERFLDKCRGAWAGQMIGVCYGAPYEFRSNGAPITKDLEPWKPGRIAGAIGQDDCYVEMTFLKAIIDHGLGISFEEAGQAFAATEYPLWHANYHGRENVRRGIMPPFSGHPEYNRCADDIDFQIEADIFGILCPGLPRESNRLCNVFGHIMNYGDGVYAGMFVAGMYSAAYFEDTDVRAVVEAGLACIPEQSRYHECISDVIRWHGEAPNDWLTAWKQIEAKWQDDEDCMPNNPFNIDARLNGAYIVMGLLYGEGDMLKTIEVSTRCGQDADCNPSNAAGVLACMKGLTGLEPQWTDGIAAMADTPFIHTDYSFNTLIPACQQVTEQIVLRAGGLVSEDAYRIPVQEPRPPVTLEQWVEQKDIIARVISQHQMEAWRPGWQVVSCGTDMDPGLRAEQYGRQGVLCIHPVDRETPAVIAGAMTVPDTPKPELLLEIASDERGDFLLKIVVDGQAAVKKIINTHGTWTSVTADLSPFKGRDAEVRIENHATGWSFEAAYVDSVKLK